MVLFEEYLQDSTNFNNAVSELVKVGGSKAYDFVSRVGKLIITNEQALKYSWLGQKGKQKFCDTRIANLIIEALIATNLAKTTKEAQSAIQLWLRRAFDRNNYKINKKN
ncbi:uncharacterized protein LOC126892713 isoform X2 [Diabrotica virgifera virgifera]|uniref:DUF4806 domain-containing protein n=1 Tax=Diabrotica virgifera virgifera TaxID=50390 RepID=A0ABM5L789_DIAVI|nr:uncharacterized protein LOC126892713 isoform X2 [Diabrotica virgifera virgifera]